jgi:hypothetical protein
MSKVRVLHGSKYLNIVFYKREKNMTFLLWFNVIIFLLLGLMWQSNNVINIILKLGILLLALYNFYWIFKL